MIKCKYGIEHHSFLREKSIGNMTRTEQLVLFLQSKSLKSFFMRADPICRHGLIMPTTTARKVSKY